MTAFKLGRCSFVPSDSPKAVTCPDDAFHHFSPYLKGLIYEELHALYLNHSKKVLLHRRLSSGSNHMTVVDPKQVLYHAIVMRASGIILAHNHPSGNPHHQSRTLRSHAEWGNLLKSWVSICLTTSSLEVATIYQWLKKG